MTSTKWAVGIFFLNVFTVGWCQEAIRVDLEGGLAYQTRNTCAVPADEDPLTSDG